MPPVLSHLTTQSKNSIVFHHAGAYYTENMDMEQATEVFDRAMMDVFLLQYEEDLGFHVSYDDIVSISALENWKATLSDLPANLQEIHLLNCVCDTLTIPATACATIRKICIYKGNLRTFPDIRDCTRLQMLHIRSCNVHEFDIPYALPPSLVSLDLSGNMIGSDPQVQFSQNACIGREFMFRGKFDDNHIRSELLPPAFTRFNSVMRQHMYTHTRVTRRAAGVDNVRNFVHQVHGEAPGMGLGGVVQPKILGAQSVHLSSINKSVISSIRALRKLVYDAGNTAEAAAFVAGNGKHSASFQAWLAGGGRTTRDFLPSKLYLGTVHGPTHMTYLKLFALVWTVVDHHPQRDDVLVRLLAEIDDSKGMCFTGCFNRLVNALVGIVDGVVVGISAREELQMAMGEIMRRLTQAVDLAKRDDTMNAEAKIKSEGAALRAAVAELDGVLKRFSDDDDDDKDIDGEVWMDALVDCAPGAYEHREGGKVYRVMWDLQVMDEGERLPVGTMDAETDAIVFWTARQIDAWIAGNPMLAPLNAAKCR